MGFPDIDIFTVAAKVNSGTACVKGYERIFLVQAVAFKVVMLCLSSLLTG